MADKYYGIPYGGHHGNVVESDTSTGLPIELRVNDSVWDYKLDVILATHALIYYFATKVRNPIE